MVLFVCFTFDPARGVTTENEAEKALFSVLAGLV